MIFHKRVGIPCLMSDIKTFTPKGILPFCILKSSTSLTSIDA
ncbi:hypothetical protein COO91_07721 [Nostoc flagelliforme CCNUN1]|uniref:Uncharacterized protein n=1 Tax=Nostoc flagelliforme CCNUN1 TaxID=2038116 RepID=A0A2K8T1U1_9NOSO|nr:hypothetical protein COO91_07721 [Nostoc flagelliforme CCNUN1]